MTCITGVSGSGKSSLINDILYRYCCKKINKAAISQSNSVKSILGLDYLDKVVDIDQSPIGRNSKIKSGNIYWNFYCD